MTSTAVLIADEAEGLPAPVAVATDGARPGATARRRPRVRVSVALSGVFAVLLVVAALFPELLTHQNPLTQQLDQVLAPPSAQHWLGADSAGRDVLARLVYGTRISLGIGVGATVISVVAGSLFGLLAGLSGKIGDSIVMRAVDCLVAVPDILLALIVITIAGTGTWNALIAVGVAGIPGYARIVRAQTHQVRLAPFVEAARILGLGRVTIALRHVLPNAFRPLVPVIGLRVGGAIGAGAGLSFLGLGAQPPTPEWGAMIASGRDFLVSDPLLAIWPALLITLTVLSAGVLGRALHNRLEGRG